MTDWDPYLDLDAGVLRNRLGITDPAELSRAEAELKDMFKRLADSGYLRCRELEDFLDGVSELLGDINEAYSAILIGGASPQLNRGLTRST